MRIINHHLPFDVLHIVRII